MTTALVHSYEPRGGCKAAFWARDPAVLVSGPAGTGKSRACLEKLHLICLLTAGVKALIVRKVQSTLASTGIQTYQKFVAAEALMDGSVWHYAGSTKEPPQFKYSNGSSLAIGGMDKASKIMSSDYDIIYVQEATELTVADWEALDTRLRNGKISFQQLLADCNPDAEHHWLYRKVQDGSVRLIESRHEDNPVLFDDQCRMTDRGRAYLGRLDRLTGVRYLRLRRGLWVSAEGLVYDEWDPAVHLVEPFKIPDDWPRFWGLDFGTRNPFVCQMWAQRPSDGALFLYREWYKTNLTSDQHAQKLLDLVTDDEGGWTEPKPQAIYADHDAEGRIQFTRVLGLPTKPAFKKVKEGIESVQRRLRIDWSRTGPGLFIFRGCVVEKDPLLVEAMLPTCTEEEIVGYVWNEAKDEPVKENDHGMDTMRYVAIGRERGRAPIPRSL